MILDDLLDELNAQREGLLQSGIELEYTEPDMTQPKPAIRVRASTAERLAELTVWDTGEADLVIGDLSNGALLLNEHREVTSRVGVADAIEAIADHLGLEDAD